MEELCQAYIYIAHTHTYIHAYMHAYTHTYIHAYRLCATVPIQRSHDFRHTHIHDTHTYIHIHTHIQAMRDSAEHKGHMTTERASSQLRRALAEIRTLFPECVNDYRGESKHPGKEGEVITLGHKKEGNMGSGSIKNHNGNRARNGDGNSKEMVQFGGLKLTGRPLGGSLEEANQGKEGGSLSESKEQALWCTNRGMPSVAFHYCECVCVRVRGYVCMYVCIYVCMCVCTLLGSIEETNQGK